MKVNVTQVEGVKIGRCRWWSNWIDIAVYDYDSTGYLLQMKVNRVNGKRFKSRKLSGSPFIYPRTHCVGDLTSMERIDK